MKLNLFTLIMAVAILISCKEKPTAQTDSTEVSKALSDKDSGTGYSIKKERYDLLEQLYEELLQKDTNLKALEDEIAVVKSSKFDSLQRFHGFNGKNEAYFNSAKFQANQITDSVLKKRVQQLIADKQAAYKKKIATHLALTDTIDVNDKKIGDLHRLLKITKTLPLIEQYQNSPPSMKSMERYIAEQNNVIEKQNKSIK